MTDQKSTFAEDMFAAVKVYMSRNLVPLATRIDKLEERLRTLEEREKSMRYRGTWNSETQCSTGDFVTHDGSIWHCNSATRDRPGTNPHAWTLAVKRGRDAR